MLKRVRRRYLALNVESDGVLDSGEFMNAVWNSVSKLFGEYGASQTSLSLIDYDSTKGFAVVRASHTCLNMVRAALASITQIGSKRVAVHVLKVSGTLKTLREKFKGRSRALF